MMKSMKGFNKIATKYYNYLIKKKNFFDYCALTVVLEFGKIDN